MNARAPVRRTTNVGERAQQIGDFFLCFSSFCFSFLLKSKVKVRAQTVFVGDEGGVRVLFCGNCLELSQLMMMVETRYIVAYCIFLSK